jgi:hypothetical protein
VEDGDLLAVEDADTPFLAESDEPHAAVSALRLAARRSRIRVRPLNGLITRQ